MVEAHASDARSATEFGPPACEQSFRWMNARRLIHRRRPSARTSHGRLWGSATANLPVTGRAFPGDGVRVLVPVGDAHQSPCISGTSGSRRARHRPTFKRSAIASRTRLDDAKRTQVFQCRWQPVHRARGLGARHGHAPQDVAHGMQAALRRLVREGGTFSCAGRPRRKRLRDCARPPSSPQSCVVSRAAYRSLPGGRSPARAARAPGSGSCTFSNK